MATRAVALTVPFILWDTSANSAKTGDSANVAPRWIKDGSISTLTTATVTEVDATNAPGLYKCSLSSTETDCNIGVLCGKSSTSNVSMIPVTIQFERLPDAAAGASGGVLISGSNSGTTTFGAMTVTGMLTVSDGIAVTRSSSNTSAVSFTGNGTGHGLSITSGNGATGNGINASAASTNGNAVNLAGSGTGAGLIATGGATGNGVKAVGGATSGAAIAASGTAGNSSAVTLAGQGSAVGLSITGGATGAGVALIGGGTSGAGLTVTTTSGDGLSITPTAGNAITATGNGTSKHGIVATGGTAGTSDGLKATAGTGGVDIRGNITGNLTGNVSGNVTVGTNNDKTGYSLSQSFPTNFSSMGIDASGNVKIQGQLKKNTALNSLQFKMLLSSDHLTGATGKTVACQRSLDGGALANCNTATATEHTSGGGFYTLNLAASDTNANVVWFRFTATGCDPTDLVFITQP